MFTLSDYKKKEIVLKMQLYIRVESNRSQQSEVGTTQNLHNPFLLLNYASG